MVLEIQRISAPGFHPGGMNLINERLVRTEPSDCGVSREQTRPGGIHYPIDDPRGMCLAERRDRGQGMDNVTHGSQPHHEQSELGLRVQTSIFSRGDVGWRRGGNSGRAGRVDLPLKPIEGV